jgi:hypothetical protein
MTRSVVRSGSPRGAGGELFAAARRGDRPTVEVIVVEPRLRPLASPDVAHSVRLIEKGQRTSDFRF